MNTRDGCHPGRTGSSHGIEAGIGEVLRDVPVVCGHFGGFIVWKISKDIIWMQKNCIMLGLTPLTKVQK